MSKPLTKTVARDYVSWLRETIKREGLLHHNGNLTAKELSERILTNFHSDFSNTFWSLIRIWHHGGKQLPYAVVNAISHENAQLTYTEADKQLAWPELDKQLDGSLQLLLRRLN